MTLRRSERGFDPRSVGANFHRLHAGLGFGLCFENAVINHSRGGCGGLPIDDGALLGSRMPQDIILGGLRIGRSEGERDDST